MRVDDDEEDSGYEEYDSPSDAELNKEKKLITKISTHRFVTHGISEFMNMMNN